MTRRRATIALAWSAFSCAPLPGDVEAPEQRQVVDAPSVLLVTTERRSNGSVLVRIDESGRRVAELTAAEAGIGDRQPAISPDGRWIVYASNRGRRSPEASNLWLVSSDGAKVPIPVTKGAAIDRDPVWHPDGGSIVFASSRAGSFDLYRVAVTVDGHGRPSAGEIRQLTRSDEQALAPAVSPDGAWVVYMSVAEAGESTLRIVSARGGSSRQLSRGPADVTPTFAADGKVVYFSGRVPGRDDSDIMEIDVSGNRRSVVVAESLADQSGPRISGDGRWLFATSVFRSTGSGQPVLSSVVVTRLTTPASERVWHALHDPAYVESRVGIAVHGATLLEQALVSNAEYSAALRRAIEKVLRDKQPAPAP